MRVDNNNKNNNNRQSRYLTPKALPAKTALSKLGKVFKPTKEQDLAHYSMCASSVAGITANIEEDDDKTQSLARVTCFRHKKN